ncbi:NAD(P)/FAD-dependent oxidoreductase [Clostridium botulinum]|uniref:NAD(P)/FAD-dependent oxidoreductase n=1 Tax=Clostridium botulinum TaxID=1491 RepID=UPI001E544F23|nr:NAD(P)/FAD-dependent oxidoreductase [Clostridium botulinum]MCD3277211.1 NAD(P)/FAD-dependent oxidoreductase [Clostridium botulinum C/D]MCD3288922.1 NAD(P)/FAD-dependent oxidoreductase [Clostridium botulinum C/D]MCD3291580.1 NAD(P)/FAD-dependent oxidoreductase [Clostridium botulinum C/D]MCD3301424.1 NAD(P)/FAD-dependent oxidoreductase [Clostridium botulinum C/D]
MGKGFGNLQKVREGKRKYAITPHIPGGFITPENLEKIAKVTKKYNGSLKITSGQRILITNLEEDDLPKIWDELGMEPAVKSQNSIKNVEMCPAGFCKRSKYNTIGIGIKLSKKYQWMDMPCRTKIGVAGCRNACGSVYSKDIGVIADVDGSLMVTVGGSAGYNPRIADIVVKGLSEKEAMTLIDYMVEYYKEKALLGEKLSFFIDRIGIDKVKLELLNRSKIHIVKQ